MTRPLTWEEHKTRAEQIPLDGGDMVETDRMVLFWHGWLSQHHPACFEVDGRTYNCCEQYMMAEKARLFGDAEALAKILDAPSPIEQKKLGRNVRGFDKGRWNAACREIVYRANLARFSQDARLREKLLATGDKLLVEASPRDTIWGIGLGPNNPAARDPANWRGTNWLGEALTRVREALRRGAAGER